MRRCRNAYDVFPRELVEELQEYISGGLLWISKDYEDRDKGIILLKQKGFSNKQISKETGLSERSIRRILNGINGKWSR